jgi:hypothetical protein
MNLITVLERFAGEYGWTARDLRRLSIAQIRAFWEAFVARHNAQVAAEQGSPLAESQLARSPHPTVGYTGKPPVTSVERADGKVETTFNLLSLVASSRGGAGDASETAGRGKGSWQSGTR